MHYSKRLVIIVALIFMSMIISYADEKVNLVVEDKQITEYEKPYIEENNIYLPFVFVKECLLKNIVLDEKQGRFFIDLKDESIQVKDDSLSEFIKENNITVNIPAKIINKSFYVPANLLENLFEIRYIENTKTVIVDSLSGMHGIGKIKGEVNLVLEPEGTSSLIKKLHIRDEVRVFDETNGWYKVRTEDGLIGYIQKEYVETYQGRTIYYNNKYKPSGSFDRNSKISLAWEYISKHFQDLSPDGKINALDIISPTCFNISDDKGTVINKANKEYVDEAHMKGYKVWALVSNGSNPALTSTILNDDSLKKKVIGQLIFYANLYHFDGINLDFEHMYPKDMDKYVDFVKEIKYRLKKQNISLSVDVTLPSSSGKYPEIFDRKALGEIVDYVVIMAYDEHIPSSRVSGSTASIGWVERGVQKSIEMIPSEKILLGIPFYAYVWKEYKDENDNIKVEGKSYSMEEIKRMVAEKNPTLAWNEETGQYYGEYTEEGAVYKIWMEDPRSIALKSSLVQKYNLAGTAAWRKGLEDKAVWPVLKEILKNKKTYNDLEFKN